MIGYQCSPNAVSSPVLLDVSTAAASIRTRPTSLAVAPIRILFDGGRDMITNVKLGENTKARQKAFTIMKKTSLALFSYPSLRVGSYDKCTSYRAAHHLREPRTRRRSNFFIAVRHQCPEAHQSSGNDDARLPEKETPRNDSVGTVYVVSVAAFDVQLHNKYFIDLVYPLFMRGAGGVLTNIYINISLI